MNFALADGRLLLFAPDVSPSLFIPGTSFSSVTGTFAGALRGHRHDDNPVALPAS